LGKQTAFRERSNPYFFAQMLCLPTASVSILQCDFQVI